MEKLRNADKETWSFPMHASHTVKAQDDLRPMCWTMANSILPPVDQDSQQHDQTEQSEGRDHHQGDDPLHPAGGWHRVSGDSGDAVPLCMVVKGDQSKVTNI